MKIRHITRTVWVLSFISLFNDFASEMLYPVMPLYLESIGFSIFFIGLLEGVAEAAAGISKIYFGHLSDHYNRRLPFVRWGYFLSVIAKPLMVIFQYPVWVLLTRSLDRLGKGLRTGARDALLSHESNPQNKGAVFGLHRGMDSLGAAIGPTAALIFLLLYPGQYVWLFALTIVPGLIAVGLTFFIRDSPKDYPENAEKPSLKIVFSYWKQASASYKKILVGLLGFALFNSSDMFLLLMVKEAGFADHQLIGFYIFFNLVYALTAYPLGSLGDRIGLKKVLTFGIGVFATVYAGMAFADNFWWVLGLFTLYGLFWAATDGIAKALLSGHCATAEKATALGFYAGWNSLFSLLSSTLAGWVWLQWGAQTMFLVTAGGSAIMLLYFIFLKEARR